MTNEEALRVLKKIGLRVAHPCYSCEDAIEAHTLAIVALEKQIPKKPISGKYPRECPACGRWLISRYPCRCGQVIDWSNE